MSVEIFRKKWRFLRNESGGTSPMPDWKKQRVLHVADDEGHLVPEAAGTSQALAVNTA